MNELDNLEFPTFDVEALKKDLETSRKSNFETEKWRVKVNSKNNKVKFRIISSPHHLKVPYSVLYYHYNVKKYGLYCLKMNNQETCPICVQFKILQDDLVKQQDKFKNDNPNIDKEIVRQKFKKQWAELYKIDAQPRFFMPGVLRDGSNDKPSVSYIEMSSSTKDKVCEKLVEHPKLMHPITGKDWIFKFRSKTTKDGTVLGGNRGEIEIDRDEDQSKVIPGGSVEEIKALINSTPKLSDLVEKPTYDDINKLFLEGMNEEDESDSFTEELINETKEQKKTVDLADTKNQIDELFKNNETE